MKHPAGFDALSVLRGVFLDMKIHSRVLDITDRDGACEHKY